MTSARTSSTVSGAASGAVAGSQIMPGWGTAIGAVVGGVGGFISGGAADRQQANAMAWASYNRQSQYNTSMSNIATGLAVAGLNAKLARQAGQAQAAQIQAAALYNSNLISLTTEYNVELLDDQLTQVWNAHSLDSNQIEMYRARERGTLVANMGASGTLVSGGGNQAVLVDQRTQEAMDLAVVLHNANSSAASISNQIAEGRWNGKVAIQQTMWEGEQAAWSAMYNAEVQAIGSVGSAVIQSGADMYNAKQAYMTEGYNISNNNYAYGQQQQQAMVKGLFTAAASYGAGAYAKKIPGGTPTTATGGGSSYTRSYSSFGGGSYNLGSHTGATPPTYALGANSPGSSLASGIGR